MVIVVLILSEIWRVLNSNHIDWLRRASEKGETELADCLERTGRPSIWRAFDPDTEGDFRKIIASAAYKNKRIVAFTGFLQGNMFRVLAVTLAILAGIAGSAILVWGIKDNNTVIMFDGGIIIFIILALWRIYTTLRKIHIQNIEALSIMTEAMDRLGLTEEDTLAAGAEPFQHFKAAIMLGGLFLLPWIARPFLVAFDLDMSGLKGISIFAGMYLPFFLCFVFVIFKQGKNSRKRGDAR
jgi:hypothetical protein